MSPLKSDRMFYRSALGSGIGSSIGQMWRSALGLAHSFAASGDTMHDRLKFAPIRNILYLYRVDSSGRDTFAYHFFRVNGTDKVCT